MKVKKYKLIFSLIISLLLVITPVFAQQTETGKTQEEGSSSDMWVVFSQSFVDFWGDEAEAIDSTDQEGITKTIENNEVPTAANPNQSLSYEGEQVAFITAVVLMLFAMVISVIAILYKQRHNFSNVTFNLDNSVPPK